MGLLNKITGFFRSKEAKENINDFEDILLESGLSPSLCSNVLQQLNSKAGRAQDMNKIIRLLTDILKPWTQEYILPVPEENNTIVYVFVGVNGVGKTTSIAKVAYWLISEHKIDKNSITIAAGDTFRAAAELQIREHARQLGIHCISHQHGADPAAVIFDAISHAKNKGHSCVLADTAGRMNTRKDLIAQLQKIYKIAQRNGEEKNIVVLMVVDGNSGLNTINQVRDFKEAIHIDSIILSKYDGSTRGGVIMSIANSCNVPCSFLGVGEQCADLRVFKSDEYLKEFLIG